MADSPGSSNLSDPPSSESEDNSRRSIDIAHGEADNLAPPSKRRKTNQSTLSTYERAPSSQPAEDQDDIQLSSDSEASAPASPAHQDEWSVRDEAQTQCLWRDCDFGEGSNNDDLVQHVQNTHCATGGPKKAKYVCEWGECQRKTSNHPSGYALKAHMRSHTKEKPYYCALPECDKAFTRSDALAKHMRTVHEPEPPRPEATSTGKKGIKLKLSNGSASSKTTTTPTAAEMGPSHDEDGNPVEPSALKDNIDYVPAYHPITNQPGFMIHYPKDIHFTSSESAIPADQLMRLLRRQLHWAETEAKALQEENAGLERRRRDEWTLKEILLEGAMESELARAEGRGLLDRVARRARRAMERDVEPARKLKWTGGSPAWRHRVLGGAGGGGGGGEGTAAADEDDVMIGDAPLRARNAARDGQSPSPPPTAQSGGGFDGDADPYDNYLRGRMAEYEERQRLRSMQNTPQKTDAEQQAAEADAVGALVGLAAQ